MDTDRIITGDCRGVLADMDAESIHACVTDPPYGLAFMGRSWDDFEPREYQQWCEEWAREVKRVLKPGAHLLAFSGNRTHHRAFSGIEDAGFEIRDTITWHYGSGFPKAGDISKTIDKRADAEREVVATREADDMRGGNHAQGDAVDSDKKGETMTYEYTQPATDAAKRWDGWKTALKPATEYVVMARKPFDSATVDCVQEHGTGALNIDGCRVETNGTRETADAGFIRRGRTDEEVFNGTDTSGEKGDSYETSKGRYPSNVIFDETQAAALDEEVMELDAEAHPSERNTTGYAGGLEQGETGHDRTQTDSGGPSRYFYTSKATRAERTLDGRIDNAHPTVKPQDLMAWLVRLVTREDQIVLDPFAGSGTTCRAAKDLGRQFVGIEQQAKWADVARVRCGLTPDDPSVVRGDDSQAGLELF
jgi:DNA modification methylase